jgi:isopentenyl phosphate kinase
MILTQFLPNFPNASAASANDKTLAHISIQMDLTIIKIGGSVITNKKSGKPKINSRNLRAVAAQLADFKDPYILIHGAGSYGHPLAQRSGIDKGISQPDQLIAMAETQRLQNVLDAIVCDELIKRGIPAFPCQASSLAVMENGRLIKMDTDAIEGLMKAGIVPVCYGVPAFDKEKVCSILSGDQIAPYLAKKLGAKRIIEAGDVEGIFTVNPKRNRNAELIDRVTAANYKEIIVHLNGSLAPDVTGGMKQKYMELLAAAETGIVAQIVHFKSLKDALAGKPIGTVIDLRN